MAVYSQDAYYRLYPETTPKQGIAQRGYRRSEYRLTAPPARRSGHFNGIFTNPQTNLSHNGNLIS
jgi:hypothetical protein